MRLFALASAIFWFGLTTPVHGTCAIAVGAVIPNFPLPQLGSAVARPYVGAARANAQLYFRPGQEHSDKIAQEIAETLEPEMSGKSVDMVAIISDRTPPDAVRDFVTQSKLKMPVLLDTQDKAVGTMGIILHPTAVISDDQGRLVAYQFFTEINFIDVVRGYLRYQLGEISEKELKDIIAPAQQEQNEKRVKAEGRLGFARALFKQGKLDLALVQALKSIEYDPTLGGAHTMAGVIYAAKGDCKKALVEFNLALIIDSNDVDAQHGVLQCKDATTTGLLGS